jgi:methylenetetrahydrofolate dehydrogenase (NADP+)/methenyltetrahydrofolate cyclohydrolase
MDGTKLARALREALGNKVETLRQRHGRSPALSVILVGEDPASEVYVRNKDVACSKVGIRSEVIRRPASIGAGELRRLIEQVNDHEEKDGLLVQLPLPAHIDPVQVREWISPAKDVDGLHPENVGRLASDQPRFIPCTPLGCLRLLRHHEIPTEGRLAVVLGRSLIVGRPMATLLSARSVNCTVTLCHSRSRDLPRICADADILVAAAGQPQLVEEDWVRPGAAVIDVGIHRIEDPSHPKGQRLVGDVHPDVARVAGFLSPVPGGVGPMTIAMLLENTVRAFEIRMGVAEAFV